jgi:hypothetical protein
MAIAFNLQYGQDWRGVSVFKDKNFGVGETKSGQVADWLSLFDRAM